ncbi:hypothetical protein [Sphingomonas jaspsi]|uniref:hypothetical protein n=1 Tax=Sphingomonas jaspsi TaxID=392409 RepID=UPI0004B874A8|nr:hypothetical protein [Sphingomonas jaspsi]
MDTNAQQFARLGNPWVAERDRREMETCQPSRKEARQNRNGYRKPTPAPLVKGRPRAECDYFQSIAKSRAFLSAFKTSLEAVQPQPFIERHERQPAPRAPLPVKAKLDPLSPEAIAAECDRLARATEAAKAEAAAIRAKQADKALGKALAAFDRKMAKVID